MRTALTACLVLASMTAAQGSVDLAEILAPPPSADYAHAATSENVLNGAFTAHQYALWLARTASDVSGIEGDLNQKGFKRGYARSWVALSSTKASPGSSRQNWLVETVEEYGSGSGAQARYAGIVSYTRGGGDDFVHEIETPIPKAFGALIFSGFTYFVMFVKGNDVYIVRMESDVDDMTAMTVAQAKLQFDLAPAYTIPPGQWVEPQPQQHPQASDEFTAAKAKVIGYGALFGVLLIARFVLLVARVLRRST